MGISKFKKIIILIVIFLSFGNLSLAKEGVLISFYPSSGNFKVGEKFSVKLRLSTQGTSINSGHVFLAFPPKKLKVLNISKDNSIFRIWPQEPTFSNERGEISFTGGLPGFGFDREGFIITIDFEALEEGFAIVNFVESQILANDGRGTIVPGITNDAQYFIGEELPSPSISICPKSYTAGEDVLYIEGNTLPNVNVDIFLEKDGKVVKKWGTISDSKGTFSLTTNELVKGGVYHLSAQIKDQDRISSASRKNQINISLSGISIGNVLLAYKSLSFLLSSILILILFAGIFLIYRAGRVKRKLIKETSEVRKIIETTFGSLEKELERRFQMIDKEPGFSQDEKFLYYEVEKLLEVSKSIIQKEVSDVENGLK